MSIPNRAPLLSFKGTENFEIREEVSAKLQSLCPDSMDLDNKYIIAEDAIVDPSQATRIFQSLFFIGIMHLGQGLRLSLAISFIRILTSETNFASLVLRSKSFSASDVMSQEDFQGRLERSQEWSRQIETLGRYL